MAKKKELKRDVFVEKIAYGFRLIREKKKMVIACGIAFFLIIAFFTFLSYHSRNKEETVQYTLSKGMKKFEEGKIDEAETYFQKIKDQSIVARLYLARIKYIKGEKEEAKKMFEELTREKPLTIKLLAEKSLRDGFK